jgi:lipopolysaccharide/colanic/teichoic acid biosynthesis glycosyltransferase
VTQRLEDTLVTGYTRLAADTPHRRIDVELRLLDFLFAVLLGLMLLPVLAGIALMILASDVRPVLYRGEREGRHGHYFQIVKFRTLRRDAE